MVGDAHSLFKATPVRPAWGHDTIRGSKDGGRANRPTAHVALQVVRSQHGAAHFPHTTLHRPLPSCTAHTPGFPDTAVFLLKIPESSIERLDKS